MLYYIYKGSVVARIIAILFLGGGIILGIYSAFIMGGSFIMLSLVAIYTYVLIILCNKHVTSYMTYKRTGSAEETNEETEYNKNAIASDDDVY